MYTYTIVDEDEPKEVLAYATNEEDAMNLPQSAVENYEALDFSGHDPSLLELVVSLG